jgi:hypothetical protein
LNFVEESLDDAKLFVWGGKMKRLTCLLTTCLCLIGVDCRAELKYKELQHTYEMTESGSTHAIDNYLIGLYEGINASNHAYYMQTKQFLYCKPNNFDLNVNNIRSIIKDAHDSYDSEGEIPVSYLLFVGLKKTFPCF